MRHSRLIIIVLTIITAAIVVLTYIGIDFPTLVKWSYDMFSTAFLEMIYKLGFLAILVVGLARLPLILSWWLKRKDKQIDTWLIEKDKQFSIILEALQEERKFLSDHVDKELNKLDRNLKHYRKSYEKRLNNLEEKSFPKPHI